MSTPQRNETPQNPQRRLCLQWLAAATSSLLVLPHASASQPAIFYDNFSNMRLLDQDGAPLQLHRLIGRVALFNFVFTGCATACPVQTFGLIQMMAKLSPAVRRSVHFVSVSLDPLSDTPKTMKAFAQKFQANVDNWSFVTGRPQDIDRLTQALWLFRSGKSREPLEEHSTNLWLVDAQGILRTRFAGDPLDATRMTKELTDLVAATSPTGLR